MVCIQAVALYGSELRWDSREVGRRDYLQLLLNRQARSILGALPTTPRGALMTESGLKPVPVTLDSRQQRFTARLENTCSSKLQKLNRNPSSSAPICRVVRREHELGQTTEGMNWPAPGEESPIRITILDDTAAANSVAQHWARKKEANIGAWVWTWWTDGSR